MRDRLTILGGSSPFTAGLIDALLYRVEELRPCCVVLHGRNRELLNLVCRYARMRLARYGWRIDSSTNMQEALAGATIVVHQIRYGGLSLRDSCEDMCAELGIIADETFGVAALLTAMLIYDRVQHTADLLQRHCPHAWILNLTNPLSAVTGQFHDSISGARCVGLCELPRYTMQQAAEVLNVPYDQIEWKYFGLNHRGFIYEAKHRGTDLISLMPTALGQREIGNINAATIGELKSIPLKYFRLVQDRTYLPPRRASELIRLRKQVAKELSQSPQMSPPSLTERYMDWYPLSLVPLIQSLQSNCPQQHVLSIRDSSPVLFERQVMVSKNRIEWTEPENIPAAASRWLDVFQRHEEQFLQTVRSPLQSNVEEALDLDPTIESFRVKTAAQRLWAEYKTRKRQESIT